MRRNSMFLGLVLAMVVGCAAWAEKGEHDAISLDQAPAAVQAAIKKAAGDAKIERISKETEDGKTIYEAEIEAADTNRTITVSEAGEVIEEETEVPASALPAAVADAVKAKYAAGKIEDCSLVKKAGQSYYEVDVEVGDADHELQIDASGKILADKVEAEEGEKHEDHDKKDKD